MEILTRVFFLRMLTRALKTFVSILKIKVTY